MGLMKNRKLPRFKVFPTIYYWLNNIVFCRPPSKKRQWHFQLAFPWDFRYYSENEDKFPTFRDMHIHDIFLLLFVLLTIWELWVLCSINFLEKILLCCHCFQSINSDNCIGQVSSEIAIACFGILYHIVH